MKRYILVLTLCSLISHGLYASEQTSPDAVQAKTFIYDPIATQKLQQLYKAINDLNYKEHSNTLKKLVENEDADPNIVEFSKPFLCDVVQKNDVGFVEVLLARKASPNPPGDKHPLSYAKTAQMAQLLVNNKADLHVSCFLDGNLLHDAAIRGRSAQVIAFLCNAGVNYNLQDKHNESPLHRLFSSSFPENRMRKTAPFLWKQADLSSKNNKCKTPADVLQEDSPELVPQFEALVKVVPETRNDKPQEYRQIRSLLTQPITPNLAGIVIDYMGLQSGILYSDEYWDAIEGRMLAAVEASKASPKRSRSPSPAKTREKAG